VSEELRTRRINVTATAKQLLEKGETLDSLTDKTLEFVSNVKSLFASIQNLHNDVGAEILCLGEVSVVCNLCMGEFPLAGVYLGSTTNLAFCANDALNRVTEKVKSAPQEKSEP
jgi:hypothetical protein